MAFSLDIPPQFLARSQFMRKRLRIEMIRQNEFDFLQNFLVHTHLSNSVDGSFIGHVSSFLCLCFIIATDVLNTCFTCLLRRRSASGRQAELGVKGQSLHYSCLFTILRLSGGRRSMEEFCVFIIMVERVLLWRRTWIIGARFHVQLCI